MKTVRTVLVLMLTVAFCFACATGVSDETQKQQASQKNTAKLRSDIAGAREGLEGWAKNLQKALDEYNSIVEGRANNPRETYGALVDRIADLEKSATRGTDAYKTMYNRAQEYYNGWKAELESYTNPDLKAAAEEQYNTSKAAFDAAHQDLVTVRADFVSFLDNLSEQTRFLGRDLSPETMATLAPQKDALNQQANDIRERATRLAQDLREREQAISGKN
jgi:uncharacterized phage infection (PIP) family protein YhgE